MSDQKKIMQAAPIVPGVTLPLMSMAALGVVFGDIGTSPLYTLSACLSAMSLQPTAVNLQGILSLIFWTLVLVVSVKYAWVIMRASNHGEGGVMALTALASHATGHSSRLRWWILSIGLLGAALFTKTVLLRRPFKCCRL